MADVIEVTTTETIEVFSDSTSVDVSVTSLDSFDVVTGQTVEVYTDNERIIDLYWPGQAYDYYNPNNPFHDTTTPPAPLGFTATSGGFSSVYLTWIAASYSNHKYTEIWRSIENNIATAGLVGSPAGNSHNDPAEPTITYYYWARFVSLAGVEGPYSSAATSGASVTPGSAANLLSSLQGQIDQSKLATFLSERINTIGTLETSVAQEVIDRGLAVAGEADARGVAIGAAILQEVSDREASILSAVAVETANRNAVVASEQIVRFDEDQVLAAAIDVVSTTVDNQTASIAVQATSINGIEAQYTVKIDNNGHVSGYGLISELDPLNPGQVVSEMIVRADKFSIVHPDANFVNGRLGFSQSLKNGIPTTVMDAASIINLNADNIDTRGLSIQDLSGNVILAAGTPLNYSSYVTAGPPTNADNTSGAIGSVPESSFPAGLKNSGITIGTNGVLSGAGGGQVNLSGLGAGAFATLSALTAANASTYISGAIIGSANIQTLAVKTAAIDNGAITNAKIGSLAVDTLQIAGEAVTIPRGVSATNNLSFSSYTSWTDMFYTDYAATSTSSKLLVTWSSLVSITAGAGGGQSGSGFMRFTQDGSQIGGIVQVSGFEGSVDTTTSSFSFVVSPGTTGLKRYSVQAYKSGTVSSAFLGHRAVSITELQK